MLLSGGLLCLLACLCCWLEVFGRAGRRVGCRLSSPAWPGPLCLWWWALCALPQGYCVFPVSVAPGWEEHVIGAQ